MDSKKIQPISTMGSVAIFVFIAAVVYLNLYVVMPALMEGTDLTFFQVYTMVGGIPLFLMTVASIVLLKREGYPLSLQSLKDRYALGKMDRKAWVLTAIVFVICFVCVIALSPLSKVIATVTPFSPPEFFPAGLNPLKEMVPDLFFGMDVRGMWYMAVFYFINWFFNIAGEELFWRAYLFPRQEKVYGKHTWIVHGFMWTFWHFYMLWNFPTVFVIAMGVSFLFQKTRNTWPGIIVHGLLNLIPLVMLIVAIAQ